MADNLNPDQNGNPGAGNGNQGSGLGSNLEGGFVEREWMKDLPGDLKTSKSLSKFEDKSSLAKSYVELESELGKRVKIPGPESTADDWGKFFSRIGRPDSPDGYEIPQGKLDKTLEAQIRKDSLAAGLNKTQAKLIAEGFASYLDQVKAAQALAREQAEMARNVTLQTVFGSNLPTVMRKADKAFSALFSPALQQRIKSSELRNDAEFIGSLAQIADNMGEDKLVQGGFDQKAATKDPYDWMREAYGQKG